MAVKTAENDEKGRFSMKTPSYRPGEKSRIGGDPSKRSEALFSPDPESAEHSSALARARSNGEAPELPGARSLGAREPLRSTAADNRRTKGARNKIAAGVQVQRVKRDHESGSIPFLPFRVPARVRLARVVQTAERGNRAHGRSGVGEEGDRVDDSGGGHGRETRGR